MKIRFIHTILFTLFLLSQNMQAQGNRTFALQGTTIAFHTRGDWNIIEENKGKKCLCIINPNRNLEVSIWLINTMLPPGRYLEEQAAEQGISIQQYPFSFNSGTPGTVGLLGQYACKREPYRAVLFAIPHADSLCLVTIRCPESCFRFHRKQLDRILDSLSFSGKGKAAVTRGG